MKFEISSSQLFIYLQFAIKFAENNNADLPLAKELCKELLTKTDFTSEKNLIIIDKPF